MSVEITPSVIALSGTALMGKTVLAEALGRQISNLYHIDVDGIRQREFPNPKRIFLESSRELLAMIWSYAELSKEALERIDAGGPVIVTGTFSRPQFKMALETLYQICLRSEIPFRIFLLCASDEEVERRIRRRQQEGGFSNVHSVERFREVKGFFEPITFTDVTEINTEQSPEDCAKYLLSRYLRDLVVACPE